MLIKSVNNQDVLDPYPTRFKKEDNSITLTVPGGNSQMDFAAGALS
jgi:hypothetical protein